MLKRTIAFALPIDTIIRRADALLYGAKRAGRNRVCLDTAPTTRAAA